MTMLGTAIAITAAAFEGKNDKGGKPYILHCLHVMHKVGQASHGDEERMCIAVMHDLIEDTDYTLYQLVTLGFSERVVEGVRLMTHYPIGHPEGRTYDNYIKEVATNDDTRMVKMFDLKHNSDITRMKGLRKKDLARLEKYHRSYDFLKNYGDE